METEMPDAPQPEKKPGQNTRNSAIFTVNENDHWLIKGFKHSVNYTMFGFVLFMTAVVWLVTLLVI